MNVEWVWIGAEEDFCATERMVKNSSALGCA